MDLVSVIGAVVVALATLFGGRSDDEPESTARETSELERLRAENTALWRIVGRHGLEDEMK